MLTASFAESDARKRDPLLYMIALVAVESVPFPESFIGDAADDLDVERVSLACCNALPAAYDCLIKNGSITHSKKTKGKNNKT